MCGCYKRNFEQFWCLLLQNIKEEKNLWLTTAGESIDHHLWSSSMFVLQIPIKMHTWKVTYNPFLVACSTLMSRTWVTEVILLLWAYRRKKQDLSTKVLQNKVVGCINRRRLRWYVCLDWVRTRRLFDDRRPGKANFPAEEFANWPFPVWGPPSHGVLGTGGLWKDILSCVL